MARIFLQLTIVFCSLHFSASRSIYKRSIPDSVYINLVSALCIEEDGSVRDACLQNLSSSLLDAIYSNADDKKFIKGDSTVDDDGSFLLQRAQIPDKRGRSKASGFYSNW